MAITWLQSLLPLPLPLLLLPLLLLQHHAALAARRPGEKCEYKDTVDLTNSTRYPDGSYRYRNFLIPEDRQAHYNYRLIFRNKSEPADMHLRGCLCDHLPGKHCVKLCCDLGQFYNKKTHRCDPLTSNRQSPTDMRIKSRARGLRSTVNIFDHFVYHVGLPCDRPQVISLIADDWILQDDGVLYIPIEDALLDTVSYCITPYRANGSSKDILTAMSCPMQTVMSKPLLLNTYAMAISVVFLIPTIVVYLVIKELRGNLRGKLLNCYLIAMATGYTTISYINITLVRLPPLPCSILGFTGYYFFMAAFLWLSVLCFDIWHNFRENNIDRSTSNNNLWRFILYSLYAWGSAGLLTTFAVWSQLSDKVDERYKPGIGIDVCWLDTRKWSAAIYFYWPNFIILVFNIVTFTYLAMRIHRVRSDVAKMTHSEQFRRENAIVILRLFLIMGISWIMDILSYCVREYKQWEFLFAASDFFIAIQGVLIFILFVLKPNVLNLIKAKFRRSKPTSTKPTMLPRDKNFSRLTSATTSTTFVSSP